MSVAEAPRFYTVRTIPERYQEARFAQYEPKTPSQEKAKAVMERMVEWLHGDEDTITDGAVLLGPPGVGKSHLAAAACSELGRRQQNAYIVRRDEQYAKSEALKAEGRPYWEVRMPHAPESPLWVNLPSLIVDLRAEMNASRDDQERTQFARKLRDHDALVVLDDLGREKVSDWTGELVYTIVNDRYERQLPTIATSNLSPEELTAAGYWPAISRLAEGGEIVVIEGPDHRLAR